MTFACIITRPTSFTRRLFAFHVKSGVRLLVYDHFFVLLTPEGADEHISILNELLDELIGSLQFDLVTLETLSEIGSVQKGVAKLQRGEPHAFFSAKGSPSFAFSARVLLRRGRRRAHQKKKKKKKEKVVGDKLSAPLPLTSGSPAAVFRSWTLGGWMLGAWGRHPSHHGGRVTPAGGLGPTPTILVTEGRCQNPRRATFVF